MSPQEAAPEQQSAPANRRPSVPLAPTLPAQEAAPIPSVQPQPTTEQRPVAFNPVDQQPVPTQTQPQLQPFTQQFQPIAGQQEGDAKISNPKYWLTILGIMAVECFLYGLSQSVQVVSLLVLIILIVAIVLSYRFTSKLKDKGVDSLTKEEKYRVVVYITITPFFAGSFLYYRLKATMPNSTKLINKMFWKVFLLAVVFAIPLISLTQTLFQSK